MTSRCSRGQWRGRMVVGVSVAAAFFSLTASAQVPPTQIASQVAAPKRTYRVLYDRTWTLSPAVMDAPTYKNIYVIEGDGTGDVKVTDDNHSFAPKWSPDGKRIAYVHIKAETCEGCILPAEYEIYVMDADGLDAHLVANVPGSVAEIGWSPDGKNVAFSVLRETGDVETNISGQSALYLADPDGTDALRPLNQGIEGSFAWSPSGTWVAYGCLSREGKEKPRLRFCLMNTQHQNEQRMLPGDAIPLGYSWSPDGSELAFVVEQKKNRAIFVARTDGSEPRHVTDFEGAFASLAWSPDGKQIMFSATEHAREVIHVANADGTAARILTAPKLNAAGSAWSHDGKRIAFCGGDSKKQQVYVVNADGSGLRSVTHDKEMGCAHVLWSPEGAQIFFDEGVPTTLWSAPYQSSPGKLYVVAADEADAKPVKLVERISSYSIQPGSPLHP